MQKQLKKFGFFASKNAKNESYAKIDDKLVKYLYKNEAGTVGKLQKRRTKSPNPHEGDGNPQKHKSRKYEAEEEVRKHKHRKHSGESVHRRHKNKELSPHPYGSHTEMYYISPEDIKKHRKKSHKTKDATAKEEIKRKHKTTSPDRDPESVHLRNKRKQTAEDIVKFITEHNFKNKANNEETEDYQWLTKKEIFNLINNSKCLPQNASSSFLKKFFVFDKQHSIQDKIDFINVANELSKTLNRYKDDNTNAIFIPAQPSEPSHTKKAEKGHKNKQAETVEPPFSRKSSKHHRSKSRDTHQSGSKRVSDATIVVPSPKRKVPKQEEFNSTQTKPKSKSFVIANDPDKESDILLQSKPKIRHSKLKNFVSSEIQLEDSESEMLLKSKVNPERHRRCLVRNTFSIVQIPPTHPTTGHLEKKKKSKAFKKYYRYNNHHDESEGKAETYHTYSDSSKMYQDVSELSVGESQKKRHKSKEKKYVSPELKAETHVSAILISPRCERPVMKTSQSKDGDKKGQSPVRKSKIPILSNTSRIVASLKKTLSPRSCKDSISSPRSNKDVPVVTTKCVNNKAEPMKDKVSTAKPLRNTNTRSTAKPVQKIEAVKEKPSSKPVRERSIEPLKGKSVSKPFKGKNADPVKEKFSNVRTSDKDQTVTGAKEKVPRSKPPEILPIKQLKEPLPKAKGNVIKTNINRRPSVDSKVSNMSGTSTISKQSKRSSFAERKTGLNKKVPVGTNRTRTLSSSPPPTYRRRSADASLTSSHFGSKSPSRVSMWSSRKSNLTSKSDTKLQQNRNSNKKKFKGVERASTKASLSNSTFGDKSMDSSRGTSFFLTKTYKDDEKLTRFQKQKMYSDSVRKMNQKTVAPQVVEVRYLTVSNGSNDNYLKEESLKFENSEEIKLEDIKAPPKTTAKAKSSTIHSVEKPKEETVSKPKKDFFEDDLPQPCIEIIDTDKFNELFELPSDKALNEILHENYNFLKKDFTFPYQAEKYLSSDDDLSSLNGELSCFDKKFDEWYDFTIKNEGSVTEISCSNNISDQIKDELNVESQDHIVDSCSAPGSEESGYATIKSRPISKSFFERPDIKALLNPSYETTLDSYCIEVQIETKSSSNCGLDIRAIESKSLQTVIECSQKCVQIKMSEEEILQTIDLDENEENTRKGEAVEKLTREVQTEEVLNCQKELELAIATEDCDEHLLADNKHSDYDDLTLSGDDSVEILASSYEDDETNEVTNIEKIKVKKKRLKFKLSFLSCIKCASEEE